MPTLTLRTDKDAYVAEDAPDANHGSGPTLRVASKVLLQAANKRLLCSFDLRALPAAAVRVVEARLRLAPLARASGRALRCHQVTSPWNEANVTWNTQPRVGADHGARSSDDDLQEWEVTASAQVAFPKGRAEFRVKDDREGSLLAKVQEYAGRERPGEAAALLVTFEAQAHAQLRSAVRPRLQGAESLPSSVRVAVSGSNELASIVRVRLQAAARLASTAWPRLRRVAWLRSTVRVMETPGALTGPSPAAPPEVAAAGEFEAVSKRSGSTIIHSSGGVRRTLKRVVQIIDTRETQAFPRAVTSEQGKPSTQDQLRRGDALLFALGTDAFRPGDMVEWQGRPWVVVGSLRAEMVGDVRIYEEVGLRRLSVVARGRLQGTVVGTS